MSKSTAMTVEKIATFVAGCDNQSIASDVRDRVAKHLLDSIGCAIGAIGAKVTLKIKSVVGLSTSLTSMRSSASTSRWRKGPTMYWQVARTVLRQNVATKSKPTTISCI